VVDGIGKAGSEGRNAVSESQERHPGEQPESCLKNPLNCSESSTLASIQSEPELVITPVAIPSLRSNFAWTLAGNLIYGGCQWGMLTTLAKLGNPSIVGQFTLGLAISAPVFVFTNLQLSAVQATDVRVGSGFGNYFTLRSLATAIGLALILCLLPFVGTSSSMRVVILLVSISKCLECMSEVTAGLLQREEQLKRVAISLMIRGALSVLVFSSAFAFTHEVESSIIGLCVVWASVLLLYDLPNVRRFGRFNESLIRFDRRELWRLAMLGLPLGWVSTFAILIVNIPRYFLQHYLGLADQGIYASLAYPVVAISLIVGALSVSVTTRLARLFASDDHRQFLGVLKKLSMLGVLTAAGGVPLALVLGRPLLIFLYRPEYADHVDLFAILIGTAGVGTVGTFFFCGLTAARCFRAQVPVQFAGMLIAVIASALLIPRFGLNGGGIALLLSTTSIALGGLWTMYRVLESGPR
jgi:O-antigen/teichoic acid export membrane protein